EAGDRLAGMGDDRLLTGNQLQLIGSRLHLLGVVDGFADAHVQDDLVKARQLHDVLVGELLAQGGLDVVFVLGPETRNVSGLSHRSDLRWSWRRGSSRRP